MGCASVACDHFPPRFLILVTICGRVCAWQRLMEIPVLFIFTHDSIGLGEDGPTHQPIEQLAAFRAMPNMLVFRPGDANEVTEAYKISAATYGWSLDAGLQPASRCRRWIGRNMPPAAGRCERRLHFGGRGRRQAGRDSYGDRKRTAMGRWRRYEKLKAEGIKARVVSMPCWDIVRSAGRRVQGIGSAFQCDGECFG